MDDRHLLSGLTSISPLDGRYHHQLAGLPSYFSEAALIRYRILVEAKWLLFLHKNLPDVQPLSNSVQKKLEQWSQGIKSSLELEAAGEVKLLEQTTHHDVKAVEYFMRAELKKLGASDQLLALIHFGATSEDINNLAYGLMTKDYREQRLFPALDLMVRSLAQLSQKYRDTAMIGRTHGQPATPTTMGKELAVFVHRLLRQRKRLFEQRIEGKMNGAVGNFNAHVVAYPQVPWELLANKFVQDEMQLTYNPLTTQIENHDSLVEMLEVVLHTNTILIGLCRDFWGYISLGYFRQKVSKNEVGSSTMPHKVNPIDFENAEGNLGIASSLCRHFCEKLPISRWQRDLSDSTVLRSLGVIFGHTELAWKSLVKGLEKVEIDNDRLERDLDDSWEVLAEPLQMVLRKFGVVDAYERLKDATRGQRLTQKGYLDLVDQISEIPEKEKVQLKALKPRSYTGLASHLASGLEGFLKTPALKGSIS